MTITLRSTKGSELTYDEMDANFNEIGTRTEPSVVNVNSSSDALVITQSGSGVPLLLKNDSVSDECLHIGAIGGVPGSSAVVQVAYESATAPSIHASRAADNTNGPQLILSKSRGTLASRTIVNNGDLLGSILFSGHDGNTLQSACSINGYVDTTPGSNDLSGRLIFSTTPDGSTSLVERMRIDSSGNVLIGTSTAGASKLVVNDDSIQLNTAKTPASAAATGTTGEICWDADYVYVCVATNTWKRASLSTW